MLIKFPESVLPISSLVFGTGHNSSDALDYFHINSVDRSRTSDAYLVSGRHTSTIYKINGTTGSIIWRLNGPLSNFTLESGVEFGFQHHARFLSSDGDVEIISLFDNSGAQVPGKHAGEYENKSSGKIISLNTKTWTATLVKKFPAPEGVFAFSQGGTQVLPNGNVFVNWGSAGAITEFDDGGEVLFHAFLESGDLWRNGDVQNYRGFRFNWTGVPNEEPAIAALEEGKRMGVHVSWNGDTETRVWRFFGVDGSEKEVLLGEEKRENFETSFYVKSGGKWKGFLAEAVGGNGEVARRTRIVRAEKYVSQYVPGKSDLVSVNGMQMVLEKVEDEL
jgi:Arylsulfotransferase (ASST)